MPSIQAVRRAVTPGESVLPPFSYHQVLIMSLLEDQYSEHCQVDLTAMIYS